MNFLIFEAALTGTIFYAYLTFDLFFKRSALFIVPGIGLAIVGVEIFSESTNMGLVLSLFLYFVGVGLAARAVLLVSHSSSEIDYIVLSLLVAFTFNKIIGANSFGYDIVSLKWLSISSMEFRILATLVYVTTGILFAICSVSTVLVQSRQIMEPRAANTYRRVASVVPLGLFSMCAFGALLIAPQLGVIDVRYFGVAMILDLLAVTILLHSLGLNHLVLHRAALKLAVLLLLTPILYSFLGWVLVFGVEWVGSSSKVTLGGQLRTLLLWVSVLVVIFVGRCGREHSVSKS